MIGSRTRGLNFSLIALSISAAVEQAAAEENGSKIVVMDLDHPEAFRVVKTDGADLETDILQKDFVAPITLSVRRSPAPTRPSPATKKARKAAPAKATKPKPPPLRPRRRPGRKS
ncbi:MAG: hypothetical protein QY323_01920 [Patescibacteria group bacterium]|nr:MAG: hypothetical protein QY323_01920 [Patescibacteria group bacterium]